MMSKLVHFVFFLSIALHVIARATESSESDTMESSRSSSSEEMRYNEDLEDLVKVDAGVSFQIFWKYQLAKVTLF